MPGLFRRRIDSSNHCLFVYVRIIYAGIRRHLDSSIQCFIDSFIESLTHRFIESSNHLFIDSSHHRFIDSSIHRSSDFRSFGGRFRGKNLNLGLVFGAGGVILEWFLLPGGAFGSFWAQRRLKDRKPTSSTPPPLQMEVQRVTFWETNHSKTTKNAIKVGVRK